MAEREKITENPRQEIFYLPILLCLYELGESAKTRDVISKVLRFFEIEPHVMEQLDNAGQPLIISTIQFARLRLVFSGLLDGSKRGIWSLTNKVKNEYPLSKIKGYDKNQIATFNRYVYETSEVERKSRIRRKTTSKKSAKETDDDAGIQSLEQEEQQSNAKREDLAVLRSMEPSAFEALCRELFEAAGYTGARNTPPVSDGGYDGVGYLKNGLTSSKIIFECKKYDEHNKISVEQIRAFSDVVGEQRADKGVFITTSSFTSDAKKLAITKKNVEIIDGEELLDLLYRHNVRCISRIDKARIAELNRSSDN